MLFDEYCTQARLWIQPASHPPHTNCIRLPHFYDSSKRAVRIFFERDSSWFFCRVSSVWVVAVAHSLIFSPAPQRTIPKISIAQKAMIYFIPFPLRWLIVNRARGEKVEEDWKIRNGCVLQSCRKVMKADVCCQTLKMNGHKKCSLQSLLWNFSQCIFPPIYCN